jgi:hypothetical protein
MSPASSSVCAIRSSACCEPVEDNLFGFGFAQRRDQARKAGEGRVGYCSETLRRSRKTRSAICKPLGRNVSGFGEPPANEIALVVDPLRERTDRGRTEILAYADRN